MINSVISEFVSDAEVIKWATGIFIFLMLSTVVYVASRIDKVKKDD